MYRSTRRGRLIRIASLIGPAACETITINRPLSGWVILVIVDGVRQTTIGRDDARKLPAPKHVPGHPGLVPEEGEVVEKIHIEDMPPIELRWAILGSNVISILGRGKIPRGIG